MHNAVMICQVIQPSMFWIWKRKCEHEEALGTKFPERWLGKKHYVLVIDRAGTNNTKYGD